MKTLKDLHCIHACDNRNEKYCDACGVEECHSIDECELRDTAIAWIKELKKNNRYNASLAFEEFFNISSKDLEEK